MMTLHKPFAAMTAADLMSHDVIRIPSRMTLRNAARLLLRAQVTGAPVIDDWDRCVGVLSSTDFMRWVEKGQMPPSPSLSPYCSEWEVESLDQIPNDAVSLHMTTDPVMVGPDTSITEVARAMLDAHIHRVVVVDEDRHPVGVLSTTDILAAVANRAT